MAIRIGLTPALRFSLLLLRVLWSRRIILLILGVALLVRIPSALVNDLYFDEGAAWHVAYNTPVSDILIGHYTHVGDMPLAYLIMKPWMMVFASEFAVRSLFILFGVAGLCIAYKIFRITENQHYSLLGMFLLAISPLHMQQSVLMRSYIISFALQSAAFYYFFLLIREKSPKLIVTYSFFAFGAAFSAFSSFYILLFFLVVFVVYALNTTHNRVTFVRAAWATLSIIILSFMWIVMYWRGSHGQIALTNYVGYGETNIIGYAQDALRDTVLFIPAWMGYSPEYPHGAYEKLLLFSSLIGVSLAAASVVISLFALFSRTKIKRYPYSWVYAGVATSIILGSFLVSKLYLNVQFASLLLFLLLPWNYLLLSLIKSLFSGKKVLIGGLALSTIIVMDLCAIYINTQRTVFPTERVYMTVAKERNKTLLLTHEFAMDLLEFYERIHQENIYATISPVWVNEPTPDTGDYLIGELRKYDTIYYFGYYDGWEQKDPKSYSLFMERTSPYMKQPIYSFPEKGFVFLKYSNPVTGVQ